MVFDFYENTTIDHVNLQLRRMQLTQLSIKKAAPEKNHDTAFCYFYYIGISLLVFQSGMRRRQPCDRYAERRTGNVIHADAVA